MDALDCYTNDNDWLVCALDQLTASAGGEGTFGLMIGGTLLTSLYLVSGGRLATASVVTVLIGTILVPALPASYRAMAVTIMFIGLVGAVLNGLETYVFPR
jgi:hypothetical protein